MVCSGQAKQKQAQQKFEHDKHAKSMVTVMGGPVFMPDLPLDHKWLPGMIERCLYHLTFKVALLSRSTVRWLIHDIAFANEVDQGQSDVWLTDYLSVTHNSM